MRRVADMFEDYGDILWERSTHKEHVRAFLYEIDNVIIHSKLTKYNDELIDFLIKYFRSQGNKNSTINRKLSALYKLLKRAERAGVITRLPSYVRLPEKNQRIRFLTHDEEAKFFAGMGQMDPSHERLCVFLIDSGARIGEALALKHGDIVNGKATFWITKSGKSRTVPLTKRALEAVSGGRNIAGGPFHDVKYQTFLYNWHKVKRKCGLATDEHVVPHILRHTCASRLVQAGIDLRRVQAFLGHQTIQMTLRYAHLATDDLDQCALALDRINDSDNDNENA